jgi:hypothetical protein
LLKVALAPTSELADIWPRHRNMIPLDALDTLDWGARRLVPLVAWRLREADIDDDGIGPLRSDLAASMLAARVRLSSYSRVLEILDRAGIDVLVLKGVGIAPLAYPDPGTRPVNDLDVLVRSAQMAEIDELIERHGTYRSHESISPALRARYRHAAEARIGGHDVDVHWRLLVDRFDDRPDDALFDRAREVAVGPGRARTLGVEDHIVHAIAHGVRRNQLPPVRWIADVARLVEHQPVDWSAVEERAARRCVEGVVGHGLELLHRRFDVPVPLKTRRALRRASGPTRGRTDLWSRSPKRTRVGGALNAVAVHYVLATRGWSTLERLTRFPEYVRFRMTVGVGGDERVDSTARPWHG